MCALVISDLYFLSILLWFFEVAKIVNKFNKHKLGIVVHDLLLSL